MTHVALSVSRQQSRRCSGLTIQREASTSGTVTRCFRSALGFCEACLLWATRTWATCADADLRVAVHRAVDRNGVAHPGLDRAHGQADQGLRGGAAPHHVHIEVEAD